MTEKPDWGQELLRKCREEERRRLISVEETGAEYWTHGSRQRAEEAQLVARWREKRSRLNQAQREEDPFKRLGGLRGMLILCLMGLIVLLLPRQIKQQL